MQSAIQPIFVKSLDKNIYLSLDSFYLLRKEYKAEKTKCSEISFLRYSLTLNVSMKYV